MHSRHLHKVNSMHHREMEFSNERPKPRVSIDKPERYKTEFCKHLLITSNLFFSVEKGP